jgi:hypothetical protein
LSRKRIESSKEPLITPGPQGHVNTIGYEPAWDERASC